MRVTKSISSISYNTEQFLKLTLNNLLHLGYISYYEFIRHNGDTDTKKPHFHLYCVPSKCLDLGAFKNFFNEPDPTRDDDLPLICEPFRVTNSYGDWYWYCLHDKDYLKAKMLQRNCHYTDADIVSSCPDFHITLVNENPLINFANLSDIGIREYVFECVSTGASLQYLLSSAKIPLGKVQSVIAFYNALSVSFAPKAQVKHPMPNVEQLKGIKKNIYIDKIKCIDNGSAKPVAENIDLFSDTDEIFD